MTQEEIEYIKRNLKWPISIEYVSSLLFVFIPLLFVYFGMKLVSSENDRSQQLVAYSSQVLDALGIRQGPSHMEVMWCGADPVTGSADTAGGVGASG